MKPTDLKSRILKLPKHSNYKIIIFTGGDLRHQRFALRLQKEFPQLVAAYYQFDDSVKLRYKKKQKIKTNKPEWSIKKVIQYLEIRKIIEKPFHIFNVFRKIRNYLLIKKLYKKDKNIEFETFNREVNYLEKFSIVKKNKINPGDVNTSEFCESLKKHNAYFLLSLGGPLLSDKIINSVKGLAINQHAGNSPIFRGAGTILWALYHRDIKSLSNTVHITETAADSGPIIRKSNICIHHGDSPQKLFFKSVALGTELMIEVVNEIISNETILVFDQPKYIGSTYVIKDFTNDELVSIIKDFNNGWLKYAINKPW